MTGPRVQLELEQSDVEDIVRGLLRLESLHKELTGNRAMQDHFRGLAERVVAALPDVPELTSLARMEALGLVAPLSG